VVTSTTVSLRGGATRVTIVTLDVAGWHAGMLSVVLVKLLRGGLLGVLATTTAAAGGPGDGILATLLLAGGSLVATEGIFALTHDCGGSMHGGIESGLLPMLLRL
jgi:hypothetical protein